MKRLTFLITLFILILPAAVFAKGPFTYITIKGPGVSGDLSVTNPALLDFFAFADFTKGAVEPPSTPGEEFEVVRSFVDENNKVQNFDLLYYYPDSGYVFYDGLIGDGASEYDGKWYLATPEIEANFRAVLAEHARLTWIPFAAFAVMLIVFGVAYLRKNKPQINK